MNGADVPAQRPVAGCSSSTRGGAIVAPRRRNNVGTAPRRRRTRPYGGHPVMRRFPDASSGPENRARSPNFAGGACRRCATTSSVADPQKGAIVAAAKRGPGNGQAIDGVAAQWNDAKCSRSRETAWSASRSTPGCSKRSRRTARTTVTPTWWLQPTKSYGLTRVDASIDREPSLRCHGMAARSGSSRRARQHRHNCAVTRGICTGGPPNVACIACSGEIRQGDD